MIIITPYKLFYMLQISLLLGFLLFPDFSLNKKNYMKMKKSINDTIQDQKIITPPMDQNSPKAPPENKIFPLPNATLNLNTSLTNFSVSKENNSISKNNDANIIWTISPEIRAFTFVDFEGLVYDLSYLYDENKDYYINKNKSLYYFNIGNFGVTTCKKDNTYIVYVDEKDLNSVDCKLLSGTNKEKPSKWRIRKPDNISSNKTYDENVIEIELPPGDRCLSDRNSFYQTTYVISCDYDVSKLAIDDVSDINIQNCKNTIKMRSQYACPNRNVYAVSNAIKKNSKLFGFILILFGFYLTFISYKYSSLTQILIGVFLVLFVSIYYILIYFNADLFYRQNELFIWVIAFFVIGIGTGLLFANSIVVCSATLGGFTGYFLTQMLMQSVVVLFTRYANIIYYFIFLVFFSLCVFIGIRFKKHFFIIYSCFIGSYGIVRGIGALEGNFLDEQQIYALSNHGEIYQIQKIIDYKYYLYITAAFLLSISGVCFQFKSYFKDMKSND